MKTCFALAVLASTAVLGGCAGAPPPGPYSPAVGPNAPGVVVIDPVLLPYLDVPAAQQTYRFDPASGLLEFSVIMRNRGAQPMTLAYTTYFTDDAKVPVEEQAPVRIFIDPSQEKPIVVRANDRRSKNARVQVAPAK